MKMTNILDDKNLELYGSWLLSIWSAQLQQHLVYLAYW